MQLQEVRLIGIINKLNTGTANSKTLNVKVTPASIKVMSTFTFCGFKFFGFAVYEKLSGKPETAKQQNSKCKM